MQRERLQAMLQVLAPMIGCVACVRQHETVEQAGMIGGNTPRRHASGKPIGESQDSFTGSLLPGRLALLLKPFFEGADHRADGLAPGAVPLAQGVLHALGVALGALAVEGRGRGRHVSTPRWLKRAPVAPRDSMDQELHRARRICQDSKAQVVALFHAVRARRQSPRVGVLLEEGGGKLGHDLGRLGGCRCGWTARTASRSPGGG